MPEKQAFPANISEENSSSKKPQEKRTDVTVLNEISPRRNKKHTRGTIVRSRSPCGWAGLNEAI